MARLEEAVAAYREALQELTRERAPLDGARTQDGDAREGGRRLSGGLAGIPMHARHNYTDMPNISEGCFTFNS
jgi:hypothetical protein